MGSNDREPGPDEVYDDLVARCAKIDRRSLRYRFDLERAVPWDRLDEPGLFFGLELLETLGLDVAPLRADAEAHAAFEWAFAAATCAEFIELEEVVLAYLSAEHAHHAGVRSITLLEEEERKHIELFRRYGAALARQRPRWAPALARAVAAAPRAARDIIFGENYPDPRVRAYLFWLFTVLFEEYTIYLHDRMAAAPRLRPTWLLVHAAHRREEEQHVITDREHLRAVRLDAAERELWSKRFILWIAQHIHDFTGLETARRCFAELRPDLPLSLAPLHRTRLRRDIGRERSFRWTREGAPALGEVLAAPVPIGAAASSLAAAPEPPRLLRSAWAAARQLARTVAQAAGDGAATRTRYRLAELEPAPAAPAAPVIARPTMASGPGAVLTRMRVARWGAKAPDGTLVAAVRDIWAQALEREPATIDPDADFVALGGDSMRAVQVHALVEQHCGTAIPVEILLECRTVHELAAYLEERHGAVSRRAAAPPTTVVATAVGAAPSSADDAVAIVAAAGRFPGAANLDELWAMLRAGRTAFSAIPRDRWDASTLPSVACPSGAFLDQPGGFDPEAFGLSEAEAREMEPQQRIFLELVAELVEHAATRTRSIGVFAGSGGNEYFLHYTDDLARFGPTTALGNLGNMVAARAAQVLGLRGPALTVDAACASSLVAVHLACRSLLAGECDLAVAGGVQTNLTAVPYVMFGPTGVLSPSGRCQPYSTSAAGFVPGEGGGAVLLKRLSRAHADGDRVLAVIRGGAMNNDGGGLSGMAPTPTGQADVIRRALAVAGVAPATIDYVEGHGSATPIGDAVEARALGQVFAAAGGERFLGSIKSNLGHCFAAAGIAGLLKTVLALHHREIPPTAGCEVANSRLFAGTSFAPAQQLMPWPAAARPRRAGVSAFGVGGTNCHLVLEEAPASSVTASVTAADAHLICLSAPSAAELRRVAAEYARRLAAEPAPELAGFVAGVNLHARHAVRRAAVVTSIDEAVRFLRDPGPAAAVRAPPRLCLVFSGPGSQYVGMGRALHDREPVFRDALRECSALLGGTLARPLDALLYDERAIAAPEMDRIEVTQPVVFAFGYAMWRWLAHRGVIADAVVGHSAAEYLAAHVAGAFGLADALRLVSERGRAMAATGPGKMAAVFAPEERVRPFVVREAEVGFAALNEPSQVVISGRVEAMDRVLAALGQAGIASQALAISCAAHSPAMRRAAELLSPALEQTTFAPLRLPFYSTVTGDLIPAGGRLDADYFRAQLPAPVAFAQAVARARADGVAAFVEVGASGALSYCVEQVLGPEEAARVAVTPLLRRSVAGLAPTLAAFGTLFERGVAFDVVGDGRRDLPLVPEPYAYRRRRLWLAPAPRPIGGRDSTARDVAPAEAAAAVPPADAPATPVRLLTPDSEPSIRDHVFRGRAIAPAALLLEFFLADARRRDPAVTGLERVLVSRSLGLDGRSRRVWTRALEPDGARLVLESSPADGDGAVDEHGLASPSSTPLVPVTIDLAATLARCPDQISAQRLYQHLAACRMTYGPTMSTVASIRRGSGELVARIELPVGTERDLTLHPSILDGAMQSIGGFLVDLPAHETATFFGFSIQRLEVHAPVRAAAWAHVRLRSPLVADLQTIRCDVDLIDDGGVVLVRYDDVGLRRFQAAVAMAEPPVGANPASTGLRRYAVTRATVPLAATRARALAGELLLIGPASVVRHQLQRALQDLGVHVLALAATTDEVELTSRLRRLAPLPAAMVVLDPAADQLYTLVRALAAVHVAALDDLLVVSRDPAPQALLRVVALEQPGWRCRGVELVMGELRPRLLRALVDEWRFGDDRHVHLGEGVRQHLALAPLAAAAAAGLPPGGVYWITGGLGGLGRAVARRLLTDHGARLLLTGRRPEPDAAQLAELGDRVRYVAADVTDAVAMRRARDRGEAELGPLRGLIHAAGVVDQALLGDRTADVALARFRDVWRPKVEGGRVLAELLADRELDFVALCSSMVALYGAPGQCDYAAANAALDELACRWPGPARRVVSIAWGPWRDTGMMAVAENRGAFDAAGVVALDPVAAADALLATVSGGDARHVMIVDVVAAAEPVLHARLGGPVASSSSSSIAAARRSPAAVAVAGTGSSPPPALAARVLAALAAELRRSTAELDPRLPFRQMGLDSLMAVRVVTRLERELGLELHPTLLFEQPTVDDVVRCLEQRMEV